MFLQEASCSNSETTNTIECSAQVSCFRTTSLADWIFMYSLVSWTESNNKLWADRDRVLSSKLQWRIMANLFFISQWLLLLEIGFFKEIFCSQSKFKSENFIKVLELGIPKVNYNSIHDLFIQKHYFLFHMLWVLLEEAASFGESFGVLKTHKLSTIDNQKYILVDVQVIFISVCVTVWFADEAFFFVENRWDLKCAEQSLDLVDSTLCNRMLKKSSMNRNLTLTDDKII